MKGLSLLFAGYGNLSLCLARPRVPCLGLSPDAPTLILATPLSMVREDKEVRGKGEAKRFRRLEVDDQFEVHGLLDRQIGGLGAFQDAVHVVGAPLERLRQLR